MTLLIFLTACKPAAEDAAAWAIEPVSVYSSGYDKGTEIISVQDSTRRAVLSISSTGEVDVLDLREPEHIHRVARFNLGLAKDKGEELTSVAFHPSLDLFAAIIDDGNRLGRLELRSAANGELIEKIEVGYGPDAVIFSKDGHLVLIANEGEDFWFDRSTKEFFTPEGSVTMVRLNDKGKITENVNIALADITNHEGFIVTQGGRFLTREVDWNGDGAISKNQDFDGNGKIEKTKVKLGTFQGSDVFGIESQGERQILIPINNYSPALLEPEYIAISPSSTKAYVTLQEDDAVAVIDLQKGQIQNYFNLGYTHHAADTNSDGWIDFNENISGSREPDGISVTSDGYYFVTADEGDTEIDDNANGVEHSTSGGRTVSVFDTETGELVGDTGNQLDEEAFNKHVYPDRRSTKKGSEPEMLVSFEIDGVPLVAVGLERAGAIELISLEDPSRPTVLTLGKIPGEEIKSPEGIAHFMAGHEHYLLTADETSGTVECFKVTHKQNSKLNQLADFIKQR
ncbi:hypothetical protein MCAMS1_01384 [biofilm metagenome]